MFKTDGSNIHNLEKVSLQDLPEEFTYPFYYEPHPLCIEASEEIQEYLITQSDFEHNFGLDNSKAGLQIGKMFGVMIVEDSKRDIGYLAGFSGKLAEQNFIKGFVPPIYDTLDKTGFYKKGETELNEINRKIDSLESTSVYLNAKECLDQLKSQYEAELKEFKTLQKNEKKKRDIQRVEGKVQLKDSDFNYLLEDLKKQSIYYHFRLRDLKSEWQQKIYEQTKVVDYLEEEIKILEDKFYVDEKQTNRVLLTASYLSDKLLNDEQDIKILLWATRLLEIGKSINLKNYQIYSSYIISNSELHGFTNKEKIQYGVDLINQQQSDVILFTGDIVNNKADEMDCWMDVFGQLEAPFGKYSILGNHDYGDYIGWDSKEDKEANFKAIKEIHPKMGFDLLCNESRYITKNNQKIALVFGRERTGLTNEELAQCQVHIHIPTNEEYSSLNVASAVQVMAYELRMAVLSHEGKLEADYSGTWGVEWDNELANQQELNGFIQHLEQTLVEIDFLDPNNPKMLMPRLRRLFQRAMPDKVEVNILRGILKMVGRASKRP